MEETPNNSTPKVEPAPATAPTPAGSKGLVDRARDILLKPKEEWAVIDGEPASVGGLITSYAAILALIAPLAILLSFLLSAYGASGFMSVLIKVLLVTYAISLGTIVLLGFAINALAPSFGGTKDAVKAMKLAVYSGTAFWFAAVILVVTGLWSSWLWLALGAGYGGYLLWAGLPVLMRVPADKAQVFVGAAIGIWAVLFIILQQIGFRIIFAGMFYGPY